MNQAELDNIQYFSAHKSSKIDFTVKLRYNKISKGNEDALGPACGVIIRIEYSIWDRKAVGGGCISVHI